MIKILIADDHAIVRDSLRKVLDADRAITVVGEATNGAECIEMLGSLKPDILLLDLRMPVKNALAVLEKANFDTVPTRKGNQLQVAQHDEWIRPADRIRTTSYQ